VGGTWSGVTLCYIWNKDSTSVLLNKIYVFVIYTVGMRPPIFTKTLTVLTRSMLRLYLTVMLVICSRLLNFTISLTLRQISKITNSFGGCVKKGNYNFGKFQNILFQRWQFWSKLFDLIYVSIFLENTSYIKTLAGPEYTYEINKKNRLVIL